MTEPGLWRFTFVGVAVLPSSSSESQGDVYLVVDGATKVRSFVDPRGDAPATGYFPLSMNILQQLEAGDIVTVEWYGNSDEYLYTTGQHITHWTGTYVGSGTPALPECQFVGQTFEYPGSCRLYYLCQSDGTIEVMSCCPDIFSPSAEACITEAEADVDFLCHSEDVCA